MMKRRSCLSVLHVYVFTAQTCEITGTLLQTFALAFQKLHLQHLNFLSPSKHVKPQTPEQSSRPDPVTSNVSVPVLQNTPSSPPVSAAITAGITAGIAVTTGAAADSAIAAA